MNFYRVQLQKAGLPYDFSHHATQAEAHTAAKGYHKDDWRDVVIELIDVPTDKDGVLRLLRGYDPGDFKPIKQWGLTPRGGMEAEPIEA